MDGRLGWTIFPGRRGKGEGASSAGEEPMHGAPLTTRESREAPTPTPVFLRAPTFPRNTLVMGHCSLLIAPGSCRMPHESRRMSHDSCAHQGRTRNRVATDDESIAIQGSAGARAVWRNQEPGREFPGSAARPDEEASCSHAHRHSDADTIPIAACGNSGILLGRRYAGNQI